MKNQYFKIVKTLEKTKLKRKTDNLTRERIEPRNEVKLVWKEKDEDTKGGLILENFILWLKSPNI